MNYYKILEIDSNVTMDEIKKGYRKKTLEYYKNNSNIDILNEAYNYLLNKNENLDNNNNNNNSNNNNSNNINNNNNTTNNNYASNIDNNINNLNNSNNINYEEDIIIYKNITLKQSFRGHMVPINIERYKIFNNTKSIENETIYIELPKGIDNNEIITIENKGNIVNNNTGNVNVIINIDETFNFSRNGLDLYYHKNISLKEALCGFKFNIYFLNDETLVINNEKGNIIKPMTTKTIKNFGMERHNIKGNLIIIFDIIYPEYINKNMATKLEDIFKEINI